MFSLRAKFCTVGDWSIYIILGHFLLYYCRQSLDLHYSSLEVLPESKSTGVVREIKLTRIDANRSKNDFNIYAHKMNPRYMICGKNIGMLFRPFKRGLTPILGVNINFTEF